MARRHIRPCAHYTCINSIRKSSGQTFQSSAFNSSLGRLSCEPGDFQGAWTCAFIPLFCLLIPTALLPTSPKLHMDEQLLHPSYSEFPPERSPFNWAHALVHPKGFAVKHCLGFSGGQSSKISYQKVPQQGRRKEGWWGKAVGGGNSPLQLLFQKSVLNRHTSSKGSSHSPKTFAVVRERFKKRSPFRSDPVFNEDVSHCASHSAQSNTHQCAQRCFKGLRKIPVRWLT